MKTLSHILGLTGSGMALLVIVRGILDYALGNAYAWYDPLSNSFAVPFYIVFVFIAAVFSVAGSFLVLTQRTFGGVLIAIGAVPSLFFDQGVTYGTVLLISAIFAFMQNDRLATLIPDRSQKMHFIDTLSRILGIIGSGLLLLNAIITGFSYSLSVYGYSVVSPAQLITIALMLIGGATGIFCSVKVLKHRMLPVALLMFAAMTSTLITNGMIYGTLLILGAVFAFIRHKTPPVELSEPPQITP